jgi:hypothetical protein
MLGAHGGTRPRHASGIARQNGAMNELDTWVSAQTFRERLPGSGLDSYVTCVWVQRVAAGSVPYTHHTVT